jgi:hypothetical protein
MEESHDEEEGEWGYWPPPMGLDTPSLDVGAELKPGRWSRLVAL